ncbi:MAG TPA: hypothetical protein PLD59_03760 [Tepidisphaeraceae bacterium]|nr:hypothetical protein [Tepidisphaeraceae bacterium]
MSSTDNTNDREERALDALTLAAFSKDLCDEKIPDLKKMAEALTPEDHAVLDSGGKDYIKSLLRTRQKPEKNAKTGSHELSTSMNRADESQDLSHKAKAEMEENIKKKAEEANRKKNESEEQRDADDERRD